MNRAGFDELLIQGFLKWGPWTP